jgi:microcompartment protein CcmL/EutN
VADVQTAVEIGVGVLERPELLVRSVVIPRLHPSLWENVADATRFSSRVLEKL